MDVEIIKKLRDQTGAGIMEIKHALEEAEGEAEKALELLMKKVSGKAAKKADRTAGDGLVHSYIHAGGKVGSLVHVACETDFVAKTDDFQKFCHDLAMQVSAYDFENIEELLESEDLRDASKTVNAKLEELTAKLGEKIEIKRFVKYTVN